MKRKYYALIACEESQAICKEFRSLGWEAYSCDLQECSGGHPEWHIQGDVLPLIKNYNHEFSTEDGNVHFVEKWDFVMAHPPCTYLTVSGNRWMDVGKYGSIAIKRMQERKEAIDFFMQFTKCDCPHEAIENPIGVMSTNYRKPDQNVQPWWFGDPYQKTTCLWLKNLPLLYRKVSSKPHIEYKEWVDSKGRRLRQDASIYGKKCSSDDETRKSRSKTYPGMARAIACTWSKFIENEDSCIWNTEGD